jgi:ubiquitin-conjugating enzyme E2 M
MINLYSVRNQKKDLNHQQDSNLGKSSPAQLRAAKDFRELSLPSFVSISQPDPADPMNYKIIIKPDEGCYRLGRFSFDLRIPNTYPHEPPKLKCETSVYHPNIDKDGNVCLNILREDWKPVLTINAIIYGLLHLFYEPNPEDPLNTEAAELLKNDRRQFELNVRRSLRNQ